VTAIAKLESFDDEYIHWFKYYDGDDRYVKQILPLGDGLEAVTENTYEDGLLTTAEFYMQKDHQKQYLIGVYVYTYE
jgi:hypothetical protein